jgi:hypothetical protein
MSKGTRQWTLRCVRARRKNGTGLLSVTAIVGACLETILPQPNSGNVCRKMGSVWIILFLFQALESIRISAQQTE